MRVICIMKWRKKFYSMDIFYITLTVIFNIDRLSLFKVKGKIIDQHKIKSA